MIPVALLDIAALGLLVVLALGFARRVRASGLVHALVSGVVSLVTLTAVTLLLFFVLWGLNYRRVPLDQKLEYRPDPRHTRGRSQTWRPCAA